MILGKVSDMALGYNHKALVMKLNHAKEGTEDQKGILDLQKYKTVLPLTSRQARFHLFHEASAIYSQLMD